MKRKEYEDLKPGELVINPNYSFVAVVRELRENSSVLLEYLGCFVERNENGAFDAIRHAESHYADLVRIRIDPKELSFLMPVLLGMGRQQMNFIIEDLEKIANEQG